MNIGRAAQESGINAKLIRHYEAIGLVPKPSRTDSGYRSYSNDNVLILAFVKRARSLGFSIKEIKKLVSLWRNKSRASADVKALAESHIQAIEQKIEVLQSMLKTLKHLAQHCHGDLRPECPILDDLAQVRTQSLLS